MSGALLFALVTAAALDVSAPAGCLDAVEVAAAIDEVGGIDVAEHVAVKITPVLDAYSLVVDIALIEAPAVHREVPLRPRECADVADLVAVLVQGQRRAALEARLRPKPESGVPPLREALPPGDPRRKALQYVREEDGGFPILCDGPVECGGLRTGLSFGGAVPLGARMALDVGWDLTPDVTALFVAEGYTRAGAWRGSGSLGLAWREKIEVFELSARGLIGAGGGSSVVDSSAPAPVTCVIDPSTGGAKAVRTTPSTVFLVPTVAVRGRFGYVFAEAGGSWAMGLDELPGAYLAIGFSLFGP